jgi:hypothetical protein
MECVHEPGFGREKLTHTFKDLGPLGFVSFDDIIHVNTQAGSQWGKKAVLYTHRLFLTTLSHLSYPSPPTLIEEF